MTFNIENDILVHCDECIIDMNKRIKEKKKFDIKKFRETKEESSKETLELIISTLYYSNNCMDTPKSCKDKITQSLVEHGQFKQEEIVEIFSKFSHESTDYTDEFISNNPEVDFKKLIFKNYEKLDKGEKKIVEIKYNFPSSGCDYKNFVGFCKKDVEILNCPDCGKEVANTPDNVTWGFEHNLVCTDCSIKRENEFDTKGLIKAGRPKHHGNWNVQKPELVYTGTDYFAILHPKCKKSRKSSKPVFIKKDGKNEFVIRQGNRTQTLDPKETTEHIKMIGRF